jgi:adenosylcobinamide-GDP ribazoletransferase
MPPAMRACRAAFFFLTRIPVGGFPFSESEWRQAAGWFPFVGLFIGATMAAVWMVAERAGPLVAATLATAAGMLLTGCFHEDGLADTADALGGVVERARVFEILKDSRIGSFAAASLVVVLLLRIVLLARLAGVVSAGTAAGLTIPGLLVLSQGLARTPPVWLMALLPYVTLDDVSKSKVVTGAGVGQAGLATAWSGLPLAAGVWCGILHPLEAVAGVVAVAAATAYLGWRFRCRVGGLTGDFLGAVEQVSEIAFLLAVAVARGGPAT